MVINRYHPFIGGNETQCRLLSEELLLRGNKVTIVTTWLWGLKFRETIDGMPVYRILPPVWYKLFWPTAIFAHFCLFAFLLIMRKKYDIIHAHQALWHAIGAVLSGKILGKKTVIKVAGGGASGNIRFWQGRQIMGGWALSILKKADSIVSLSEQITEELASVGIRNRVTEIPNGVKVIDEKVREPTPDMRMIKSRFEQVALYTGRLTEEKGVDILLEAWREVLKEKPRSDLVIVGEGPERKKLTQYVARHDMEKNVTFTGEKKDVSGYHRVSDIFILPSRGEGMSNSLLEAMAFGLPCVVSGIGGNVKLIEHKKTGLVFNSEDPDSLSKCIIEILDDKELASALTLNAKELIRETFSMEIIGEKYLELYSRLQSQKK